MKRRGLGSAALIFLASSHGALAADAALLVKAPAIAQVYNWTGFYFGAHAGYGWGTNDWHAAPATLLGGFFEGRGAIAGGQAGFNVHLGGGWVAGIEIDATWSNIRATHDAVQLDFIPNLLAASYESKVNWLVSAAFRTGIAVDRLWVYGKLGAAVARDRHAFQLIETSIVGTTTTVGAVNETRVGPLFGFGAEYGITSNWSAKLEYNYIPFANTHPQITLIRTSGGPPITQRGDLLNGQTLHLVKAGVNYRIAPQGAPAADPVRAAGYDWSGFYVGVQAGYGWGHKKWDPNTPGLSFDIAGWLAGGQIGVNAQSGRVVVGVEAEGFWTGIDGDLSTAFSFAFRLSSKVQWLGLATGRIGYTPWDHWLMYLKGGVAFAHEEHSYSGLNFAFAGDRLRNGWVVGGGVEYAIASGGNWSIRAEYNYIDFGRRFETLFGADLPVVPIATGNFEIVQALQLVKVGLNYRFGVQPATVVARY